MVYIPNRGDIISLPFNSSSGREMNGPHYALVLSGKLFNQSGLAMVCPISCGPEASASTHGTIVTLMGSGTDTQGAVHCHQLKSLDWRVRGAQLKEAVPDPVLQEALGRVEAILFG